MPICSPIWNPMLTIFLACNLDAIEYPVARSCEIKSAVVVEDEHEHGRRATLNYGHTFGHAIEIISNYKLFLHGEAIALGMHAAGVLARNLDMVNDEFVRRQRACIEAYKLPVSWSALNVDNALAAMKKDKKARAGTLKFIVPDAIGSVAQRTDITEAQARAAFEALLA